MFENLNTRLYTKAMHNGIKMHKIFKILYFYAKIHTFFKIVLTK